jgi:hypothetical protein
LLNWTLASSYEIAHNMNTNIIHMQVHFPQWFMVHALDD